MADICLLSANLGLFPASRSCSNFLAHGLFPAPLNSTKTSCVGTSRADVSTMLNDDVQTTQWGLQYSLNIQASKMEVKTLAILHEGAVLEHFPKGSKVIRFITYKSLDRVQWAGGRAVLWPKSQASRRQTAGKQISVIVFIQWLGQMSLIFHGLSSEWLFLKESWGKKGENPILRFRSKCPDLGASTVILL